VALVQLSTEIRELKTDMREVLNLMRLLGSVFQRPVFGTVKGNPVDEFEKRLTAMLEKHGIER
jgi:hypothetical protein